MKIRSEEEDCNGGFGKKQTRSCLGVFLRHPEPGRKRHHVVWALGTRTVINPEAFPPTHHRDPMLTTPYHFSIAACPITPGDNEILYRGSLPAARNLAFLRRLRLRTIVYLLKKPLGDEDGLVRWAKKRGVSLKWVIAESMGEESLGMGKKEVGEVLKVS